MIRANRIPKMSVVNRLTFGHAPVLSISATMVSHCIPNNEARPNAHKLGSSL